MDTYKGHAVYPMKNHMVDVSLFHTRTTINVWWSPQWNEPGGGSGGFNSYVLMETKNDDVPTLVSINGRGEVRWVVFTRDIESALQLEREGKLHNGSTKEGLYAARHFGLIGE